eukprot:m.553986 g.553986  ORF g.553986 m.553986 type:complete len:596 (-) comp22173_c0_seq13:817-2604(-)
MPGTCNTCTCATLSRPPRPESCAASQPECSGHIENSQGATHLRKNITDALITLGTDANDLYLPKRCPIIHDRNPSAVKFFRDHVSTNTPCVFDALPQWPAHERWTQEYLCEKMGAATVSVELTPDGRGDALVDIEKCRQLDEVNFEQNQKNCPTHVDDKKFDDDMSTTQADLDAPNDQASHHCKHECQNSLNRDDSGASREQIFVMPATVSMTMTDFFEHQRLYNGHKTRLEQVRSGSTLDSASSKCEPAPATTDRSALPKASEMAKTPPAVAYISHQDSSLTDEYEHLLADIREFDFAREAFGGAPPDAVNLWCGPDDAVTSLHKDHYENIYVVLRGEKHFLLFPPTDLPFLYQRECCCGQYVLVDAGPTLPVDIDLSIPTDDHANTASLGVGTERIPLGTTDLQSGIPRVSPGVGRTQLRVKMLPDTTESDAVCSSAAGSIHSGGDQTLSSAGGDSTRQATEDCCEGHETRGGNTDTDASSNTATGTTFCASRRQWIAVDPDNPDHDRHPLFRHAHPLRVVVRAGQALYLPSMWYHQVSQHGSPFHSGAPTSSDLEGCTLAVNFWYDMSFDSKYAYFKFIESVSAALNDGSAA